VSRADRRRTDRTTVRRDTRPGPVGTPSRATMLPIENTNLLVGAGFVVVTGIFLYALWGALEARITWYLAVDQFGYLQFAHDLLHGKVFHDWEPAKIMGVLPKRTDVLAQTYVLDNGRMYCRYSPGFPMLVAGWLALFGDARVSFLNPTLYLAFLGMVIACERRLSGSVWRGLVVVVLIVLFPTMMYWWSLTLTRDLSAHLFAFVGLYQLIPRKEPLTPWRAAVAGLGLGFAASIRNDAVLYLLPATLLAIASWRHARPERAFVPLAAVAGLVLGLLPTLSYNAITTGNPFRPTQGMEIESFLPSPPPPTPTIGTGNRIGYPSLWKGGSYRQVQGGGLRLQNFPQTAPAEWSYVYTSYGTVLLALAVLGAIAALVRRPALFLFTVPYAVTAFLFYSCWARPDRRYIIGIFSMIPFLVTEGVFGTLDVLHEIAKRRGPDVARPIAAAVAMIAILVALATWGGGIALPPIVGGDAPYLSKGTLAALTVILPAALGLGAVVTALSPAQRVTPLLAPALAVILAGYGTLRANDTSSHRAPFQGPQAAIARETLRRTLEPRSVVITAEDMGRPAENIEHYGGFPAFYVTDLKRWRLKASSASLSFLAAGVRPYLLLDQSVPERGALLADLADQGFIADRIVQVPPGRNMEYFVASPNGSKYPAELFRISYPKWEELLRGIRKP
jgi:hypothetical protein